MKRSLKRILFISDAPSLDVVVDSNFLFRKILRHLPRIVQVESTCSCCTVDFKVRNVSMIVLLVAFKSIHDCRRLCEPPLKRNGKNTMSFF